MLRRNSAIRKHLRFISHFESVILPNAVLFTLGLIRGIRFADLPKVRFHRGAARYAFVVLLLILFALPLPPANAAKATLGWDANDEPDLEGYVIYRNTNLPGPPYSYSDDLPEDDLADPLHPAATLTGLQEGKEYYIALTAYNSDGVESGFSDDICVEVVNNTAEPCSTSSSPIASSNSGAVSGIGGGSNSNSGCFISTASQMAPTNYLPLGLLLILALIAIGFCRQKKIHRLRRLKINKRF